MFAILMLLLCAPEATEDPNALAGRPRHPGSDDPLNEPQPVVAETD